MNENAEQIYALLVEANPVPDIEALPPTLAETSHLHLVHPRRDDMLELHHNAAETFQPLVIVSQRPCAAHRSRMLRPPWSRSFRV